MPEFIILVGNIASGKSTFCKKMAHKGYIIINDDSIVTGLHGGDNTLYATELKPLYKTVENTIINTAVAMGYSVIIDKPNITKSTRRRFVGLAYALDIPCYAKVFPFEEPLVHAKRRYDSDPRGYVLEDWINKATEIDNWYEPVDSELEGLSLYE